MRKFVLVLCAVGAALGASGQWAEDPTVPASAMLRRLKTSGAQDMKLLALVAGADGEAVAMVRSGEDEARLVRKGTHYALEIEEFALELVAKSVTSSGVVFTLGEDG